MPKLLVPAAVCLLAIACSTPVDSKCNAANCRALSVSCHQQLTADVAINICIDKGRVPPSGSDLTSSCIAVCEADGDGDLLECIGQRESQCLEEPRSIEKEHAVAVSCKGATRTIDADCKAQCWTNEKACAQACPATTWDACYSCATQCSVDLAHCFSSCPIAN